MGRPPLPIGSHGEIRLYRRGSRWEARTTYRGQDGKRRQASARGRTQSEAKNRLRERVAGLMTSEPHGASELHASTSLNDVMSSWLDYKTESQTVTKGTLDTYRLTVKRISLRLGDKPITQITSSDIISMTNGYRPGTAGVITSVLVQVFRHAKAYNLVLHNPAEGLPTRRGSKPEVRVLTVSEIQEIRTRLRTLAHESLAHKDTRAVNHTTREQLMYWMIDLLAATGCRPSEILALRWRDIDLSGPVPQVMICGTLLADGTRQDQTKGKTDRILRLPAFAVETIEEVRRETIGSGDAQPDGPVLSTASGSFIRLSTMATRWSVLRREISPSDPSRWEWVTFKTWRKTLATLIENEFSPLEAAAQLGHHSPEITMRHYIPERATQASDLPAVWDQLSGS